MSVVNGILFSIIVTLVEWLLHFIALTHIMQRDCIMEYMEDIDFSRNTQSEAAV